MYRISIFMGVVIGFFILAILGAGYYLKSIGVTYQSFNFDFPNELSVEKLHFENEDMLLSANYLHVSIRLNKLLKGEVSGRYLEADDMWVELKPSTTEDTSTFELADLIPIEVDRVDGTNIHYQSIDGLDSLVVDLPTLYATDFVLNNGIFIDSISSQNSVLIISFPDTTESADTGAAMANMIAINANALRLDNAHIQFNYPDESYDVKKTKVSLNGFGTNNPIDFKLNELSFLYQDSIEISSNGEELSITQAGDLALENFGFQTPLFKVAVTNAGATAQNRYYATINKSHINSDVIRMFVDDFPVVENTDMVFNGGVAWDNDSIILDHFKIEMDEKTMAMADGYLIYGDTLTLTNVRIITFKSTLFELQRLFSLDELADQKDIQIASNFWVTGNLWDLKVDGNTNLNNNFIDLNLTYSSVQNSGTKLSAVIKSASLNPNQIVTASPEDVALRNLNFVANTILDSNFNIQNLTASFKCAQLIYDDYKLTDFKSHATMKPGYSTFKSSANEQNFNLAIESKSDVLNSDSIPFTGLLNMDIPTFSDLSKKSGNANSPFNGYLKNTDSEMAFVMEIDSLKFDSDSLEHKYTELVSLTYKSDTTYGINIDLNVNDDDVFWFKGDPHTFEWLGAAKVDTANYPYFESEMHLNLDSALFHVLIGKEGSLNIEDLRIETAENSVSLTMIGPLVVYEDYRVENTLLNFSTNFKTYHGDLTIDSLKNPYANLDNIRMKIASSEKNKVDSDFHIALTEFNELIDFGIQFTDSVSYKNLKFENGRPIIMGRQKWEVTENEGITLNENWDITRSHFTVRSDSQSIALSTESKVIDLNISNFLITPIYTVLTGDSVLSGLFSLDSEYDLVAEKLSWEGELSQIKVDTVSIGNLTTTGLLTATHFESREELIHEKSELYIDVSASENVPLQYKLDLKKFDLTNLNPLYKQWGFEGEIEGKIDGELVGVIEDEITAKGHVRFTQFKAQLDEYGMFLGIENSKIDLNEKAVSFNDFKVKDKEGELLVINGVIPFQEDLPMHLHMDTKRFKILDQPDKTHQYWGVLDISTNLNITGKYDNLTIKGYLSTLKSSNIGYRYQSEIKVNKLDEEIEFTSFSDTVSAVAKKAKRRAEAKINWDVKMDFGKTKIYVLLSEVSNDFVRMTASGNLKLKTGRGQMPKVFGEVKGNNGSVFYAAPMVSDLNLKIETISVKFRGDAENPIISFKGTEVFRVSTNEISGQSGSGGSMVPVEVIASVNESELDEFELSFDIQSNDGEMGSYIASLPQSTRETYAMNLLVFGTLTQGDQSGNTAMRAVVSKLNELSRRNIKSADLAFYVDSGEDVSVSNLEGVKSIGYDFSKEFFDDKVRVTVGGEVVLESNNNADGRKQFNPLGNVSIDYRLKEDPEINVFASKKDSYLGPVDGQVDQYSVGISFSKWFKNIFHKKKKDA